MVKSTTYGIYIYMPGVPGLNPPWKATQESGGDGMNPKSFKLGSYAPGNAARDFFRNVPLPLDWVLSKSGLICYPMWTKNNVSVSVPKIYMEQIGDVVKKNKWQQSTRQCIQPWRILWKWSALSMLGRVILLPEPRAYQFCSLTKSCNIWWPWGSVWARGWWILIGHIWNLLGIAGLTESMTIASFRNLVYYSFFPTLKLGYSWKWSRIQQKLEAWICTSGSPWKIIRVPVRTIISTI